MIKCGVCGSENEAGALFCGVCGSPLKHDQTATEVTPTPDEPTTPVTTEPVTRDDAVVPGKGGARRDLGVGGEAAPTKPHKPGESEIGTETAIEMAAGPTVVCSVCGTINDATRTYCRKCANELKPMAAPPPDQAPVPQRRGLSPIAIALGAAGVVLAGGAIVLLLSGALGPRPSGSPAAEASPDASVVIATQGTSTVEPSAPIFDEGDPEGRIVFARCDSDDDCVIVLLDLASGEETELTDLDDVGSATDPAFAHDGNRVAFTTADGIAILAIDSGEISSHSNGPEDTSANWSPDDSQLTFSASRPERDPPPNDDRELRIDGVSDIGPSEPLTLNDIEDHDGVFTIDGESIIWVQGRGDERELLMIDLDSREETQLTDDDANDVDPAVAPDGEKIAFVSNRESGDELDLFLMDLATQAITPLPDFDGGDAHDPTWSPGGRYIVFSGGDGESNDLFLLDLADSSIDPLTEGDERDGGPSWRP